MRAEAEASGAHRPPGAVIRAWEAVDSDFDGHLERIRSYLRQPSVSRSGEGIEEGAARTAELIARAGGEAEIVPSPGHPVVVGHIAGRGPTLLRYGMYDVQPADEPGWATPPFAAELGTEPGVGPVVVARGAANSKGSLASFLLAVASARRAGDLPCSVTLVVDGEEELGSPSLPAVMAARKDDLAADAAFDLDLNGDRSGAADVYLGCKAVVSVALTVRGGDWGGPRASALHSSSGAVVRSPAWSLVRALAGLVGPDDAPALAGLAPGAPPPEDEPLVDALVETFDRRAYLEEAGVARFRGEPTDREVVEALLYAPALNLNGIAGGYPTGGKTIIPHEASAALDLRIPYGADIDAVLGSLARAVQAVAPEVELDVFEKVCPPSRTSVDSDVARAMIASHAEAGAPARVWPSAPWWAPFYLFSEEMGLPFAAGGAGHAGRAHAANEYASIEGLRAHMKQSIAFLHRYAADQAVA